MNFIQNFYLSQYNKKKKFYIHFIIFLHFYSFFKKNLFIIYNNFYEYIFIFVIRNELINIKKNFNFY